LGLISPKTYWRMMRCLIITRAQTGHGAVRQGPVCSYGAFLTPEAAPLERIEATTTPPTYRNQAAGEGSKGTTGDYTVKPASGVNLIDQ
jgi:hypothetical protein